MRLSQMCVAYAEAHGWTRHANGWLTKDGGVSLRTTSRDVDAVEAVAASDFGGDIDAARAAVEGWAADALKVRPFHSMSEYRRHLACGRAAAIKSITPDG